jgi:hypothetical protein
MGAFGSCAIIDGESVAATVTTATIAASNSTITNILEFYIRT